MRKRVLFISSTGGHLNELLQLKPLFEKYDSYLITEKTKSNLSLKDKYPKRVSFLMYGSYTTLFGKITYPFNAFSAETFISFFAPLFTSGYM